ncbi:sugar ABC transporter permease [Haloarcula hispanica]|uniref:Sugar ABC transporter permease n=1 Tax=Haloarcula hispanica TaxID=51589 RepID=A0A482T096_HALHI|nr:MULTISPECIES: sugar ABC transporter permease [Haloarcula]KAA9404245.1 sugar ABC transporter permease [Haloarcula sp. CBA1131]KAA9405075.1 sugar ABC transporter permease [Haloarcula hispanica]KZX46407.1 sugar ABC transporter permease [Haloarcula sp. K1]MCJ0621360.1 sugar ABC transporter permease [Haloarcula hispanica]RYJ07960.1 sugar ABC transporter permease [Haloarcula hispanica]
MSLAEEYTETSDDSRLERGLAYVQRNSRAYLLIAPAAVFLLAVVGYPIIETFRLSLYQSPADSNIETFVGLQHYVEIFNSDIFYRLLWQTGRWVVVGVAGKTLLGLLIAVHLKGDIRGRKFFRTAFLIPWGIPYAISAVVFRWIEHPQFGYLNAILLKLGIIEQGIGILGNPSIAWLGVVVADIWIGTPFMAIIFLAGLQSIPQELYEAAAIDGAEKWHQFRYITLPQLKSVVLIATLLSTIWTFVSFDVIWTMTGGGPISSTATLVIHIYQVGLQNGNLGRGAAYSVIGFLFLFVFAIIYLRIYTRGGDEL